MPRNKLALPAPVVFGEKTRPKEQSMDLKDSKYLVPKKPKVKQENNWKEVLLSETHLIAALEAYLVQQQVKVLKRGERIERVLVGEPANGVYPLSIAILKGKED